MTDGCWPLTQNGQLWWRNTKVSSLSRRLCFPRKWETNVHHSLQFFDGNAVNLFFICAFTIKKWDSCIFFDRNAVIVSDNFSELLTKFLQLWADPASGFYRLIGRTVPSMCSMPKIMKACVVFLDEDSPQCCLQRELQPAQSFPSTSVTLTSTTLKVPKKVH